MQKMKQVELHLDEAESGWITSYTGNFVQNYRISFTSLLVGIVGFSEGLTHLAQLAIYYVFKDDLALDPSHVSFVLAVPVIPAIFKPFFAFLSDVYPIFGLRRKPYLCIFAMVQSLGFVQLAYCSTSLYHSICALFIIALGQTICSTVAEAIMVETCQGKPKEQGMISVTDYLNAKALGSLSVAYSSGHLLEEVTKKQIFLITAIYPLMITVAGLCLTEPKQVSSPKWKEHIKRVYAFMKQDFVIGPIVYILTYTCGPDYDDSMFFFYTNKLGLIPRQLGMIRLSYGIAAIVGVLIYRKFFSTSGYRSVLIWSLLVSIPIYASPLLLTSGYYKYLHLSESTFVISGGFFIEAIAEIQLLPLIILTSAICPNGMEGTVFSLTICIRHIGMIVSKGISGVLAAILGITAYDLANLDKLIIICTLGLFVPLCFINYVPTDYEIDRIMRYHNRQYGVPDYLGILQFPQESAYAQFSISTLSYPNCSNIIHHRTHSDKPFLTVDFTHLGYSSSYLFFKYSEQNYFQLWITQPKRLKSEFAARSINSTISHPSNISQNHIERTSVSAKINLTEEKNSDRWSLHGVSELVPLTFDHERKIERDPHLLPPLEMHIGVNDEGTHYSLLFPASKFDEFNLPRFDFPPSHFEEIHAINLDEMGNPPKSVKGLNVWTPLNDLELATEWMSAQFLRDSYGENGIYIHGNTENTNNKMLLFGYAIDSQKNPIISVNFNPTKKFSWMKFEA